MGKVWQREIAFERLVVLKKLGSSESPDLATLGADWLGLAFVPLHCAAQSVFEVH